MFVIILSLLLLFNFHNTAAENDIVSEIKESNDNRFVVNAVIHHLLDMFRNVIRNGDHEKNIKVLDPYEFDRASFDITGKVVSVGTNVTNGLITGLGDYQLGPFTFTKSDLSIELQLTLPLISFLFDHYEMEGKLFETFPIAGRGRMQIKVENMLITGKIYLKQSDDGKSILLSHFEDMEFKIEQVKSHMQFYNNLDEIINVMIEDLLADYLSRFSKAICLTYEDKVVQILNSILEKFENWHIISVIL